MQVVLSGGQNCNQCKWRHLVAKFATNASGAIWWPNLQLMQVAPSGVQIYNLCKWCHVVAKFNPSHGVNFWVCCASGNVCAVVTDLPLHCIALHCIADLITGRYLSCLRISTSIYQDVNICQFNIAIYIRVALKMMLAQFLWRWLAIARLITGGFDELDLTLLSQQDDDKNAFEGHYWQIWFGNYFIVFTHFFLQS